MDRVALWQGWVTERLTIGMVERLRRGGAAIDAAIARAGSGRVFVTFVMPANMPNSKNRVGAYFCI